MNMNWYKYFNYGTIIFVLILLLLILTEAIPRNFYVPILALTIVIFIARIVARIIFSVKSRSNKQE
jgi:hypothetical protein